MSTISRSDYESSVIASIELESVKKRIQMPVSERGGLGWSEQRVNQAEEQYRRWLYVISAYPEDTTPPTIEIDKFWHYHILDTRKYECDCNLMFGRYLHHDPSPILSGDKDMHEQRILFQQMKKRYFQLFGLEMSSESEMALCSSCYCDPTLRDMEAR